MRAARIGVSRACPSIAIRWRPTTTRGRRSKRCAQRSTAWRTGSSRTGSTALKRSAENEAEAERRRDLAMRSVFAHESAIDRAGAGGRRCDRVGRARRSRRPLRRELRAARRRRLSARHALRAHAQRRAHERDAGDRRIVRVRCAARSVSTTRRSWSRRRPSTTSIRRGSSSRRPTSIPSRRTSRAAPRRWSKSVSTGRGGRAFVLFTSYARLREVHALVRERIAFPVRVQGELPRSHLLEWFRRTPGAVLFATATFWEGIDVVGDALSCVIIDRLPFPSPSDPLVMARVRALEARGLDGFEHYMIPAATVRLETGLRATHSQQQRSRSGRTARRPRRVDALRCDDPLGAAAGHADRAPRRPGCVLHSS